MWDAAEAVGAAVRGDLLFSQQMTGSDVSNDVAADCFCPGEERRAPIMRSIAFGSQGEGEWLVMGSASDAESPTGAQPTLALANPDVRVTRLEVRPQAAMPLRLPVNGMFILRMTELMRQVYYEEGSERRACLFRIEFVSSKRQITRSNIALWQARVREALIYWSESDDADFELK